MIGEGSGNLSGYARHVRIRWAVVALCAVVAGCGGKGGDGSATPSSTASSSEVSAGAPTLGFPVVATKNTTRVAGGDAIADAAAIALATYPARTPESRPAAVILAEVRDWRTGLAASVLVGRPIGAPVLFADGDRLPDATKAALDALQPKGSKEAGGAQVIRVGTKAPVEGFKTTDVTGASPAALAAAVDRVRTSAAGTSSPSVMVANLDRPEYALPAAGYAAKTGVPLLWVSGDGVPAETAAAIKTRRRARIYVLGPAESVSDAVVGSLEKLGTVKRVSGNDPVGNAIAFARYSDGDFGWSIVDPGHGLVFANARRPQDAAAAAPLSASGTYGPLLLIADAGVLPEPLQNFLLDIQPGYDADPVRGVYNHGWIIGDESAIAAAVQARIDTLLEIQPVDTGA